MKTYIALTVVVLTMVLFANAGTASSGMHPRTVPTTEQLVRVSDMLPLYTPECLSCRRNCTLQLNECLSGCADGDTSCRLQCAKAERSCNSECPCT